MRLAGLPVSRLARDCRQATTRRPSVEALSCDLAASAAAMPPRWPTGHPDVATCPSTSRPSPVQTGNGRSTVLVASFRCLQNCRPKRQPKGAIRPQPERLPMTAHGRRQRTPCARRSSATLRETLGICGHRPTGEGTAPRKVGRVAQQGPNLIFAASNIEGLA